MNQLAVHNTINTQSSSLSSFLGPKVSHLSDKKGKLMHLPVEHKVETDSNRIDIILMNFQ